jgi:beta-glucosidase
MSLQLSHPFQVQQNNLPILHPKKSPMRIPKKTHLLRTLLLQILLLRVALGAGPANIDAQLDALLSKMTEADKLGQLEQLDRLPDGTYRPEHPGLIRNGLLGSTINVRGARRTNELQRIAVEESRLKIPVLFGFDVIHGYHTIFPIPLAESCSWDPKTVERAASIAAAEASAAGGALDLCSYGGYRA